MYWRKEFTCDLCDTKNLTNTAFSLLCARLINYLMDIQYYRIEIYQEVNYLFPITEITIILMTVRLFNKFRNRIDWNCDSPPFNDFFDPCSLASDMIPDVRTVCDEKWMDKRCKRSMFENSRAIFLIIFFHQYSSTK